MNAIVPRDRFNNTAKIDGALSDRAITYRDEWDRVKRLRDPTRLNPRGHKIGYWGRKAVLV